MDWARRAEAEATIAGVSPAGLARCRFKPWPTPALPVTALAIAVRAGAASGDDTPRVLASMPGLSTFCGEAATGARVAARVASRFGGASGVMLGGSAARARAVLAAAICVAVLADGARAGFWLSGAAELAVACRATVARDGRG
jgi:hypothetical protein